MNWILQGLGELQAVLLPAPAAPATPAAGTAYPSTQTVDIDGKKVEFQMYCLKDANGNPTNYGKVRDLGEKLGFTVGWTAEKGVYILTGG